jgi:1-acyl-sn-glycerol-3-phosphate acyltransferase
MHAARHCRFVAKAEVRRWPLIGTLATGGGTLYIERESRRDALRVVHHMADSLRAGDILAVFPEGTTSDGVQLLPFHANLIQAAISAGAPVQPVALRFQDARTRALSLSPCYIGDDTLLGSIWRTLSGPDLVAVVAYGEPEVARGRERRAWAADLQSAVDLLRQA